MIGLDTSDKNLDGLIPDITNDDVNGIKLSNPQKIKLKRAIQKLQESRGYENGNNKALNINPNGKKDNLMQYINNDEVKAIEVLANHIESSNKILDSLVDECGKIEQYSTSIEKEIKDVFLTLVNELNKRKKELLTKSRHYYQRDISKIQEKIELMKDSISECEKIKNECGKSLAKGITIDKLSQRAKDITNTINECVNKQQTENSKCNIVVSKSSQQQRQSNFDSEKKSLHSKRDALLASIVGFAIDSMNITDVTSNVDHTNRAIWSSANNYKGKCLTVTGERNQIVTNDKGKTANDWSTVLSAEWIDPNIVARLDCKFKIINIDNGLRKNNTCQIIAGISGDVKNNNDGSPVGSVPSSLQFGYIGGEAKGFHGMCILLSCLQLFANVDSLYWILHVQTNHEKG